MNLVVEFVGADAKNWQMFCGEFHPYASVLLLGFKFKKVVSKLFGRRFVDYGKVQTFVGIYSGFDWLKPGFFLHDDCQNYIRKFCEE